MDDQERIQDPRWVLATVRVAVRRQLRTWNIHHIGHNDHEDLLNVVLVSLYDNDRALLKRFDPRRATATHYLRFLTKQRLTEVLRKQGRRVELEKERSLVEVPEEQHTADDPESLLYFRELQEHLEKKLNDEASPTDRQIFHDAFYGNMSNPEIAEKMNIPKARVADRRFALKKQIPRWLAEIGMFVTGRNSQ